MANILTAAADAAKDRIKSSVDDAKQSVMNQFDPRQSIYQLGLGIGPMIRQTVAEFNKQQKKESDKSTKDQKKSANDIKREVTKSSKSLDKAALHLKSMDHTLKEMRKINAAQLKMQLSAVRAERVIAGSELTALYRDAAKSAASVGKDKDDGTEVAKKGGMLESLLGSTYGKLALGGLGVVAGGLVFQNREQIEKFINDFLSGAGLPNVNQLASTASKALVNATTEIAGSLAKSLVQATKSALINFPKEVAENVEQALNGDRKPLAKQIGVGGGVLGGAMLGWKAGMKLPGMSKVLAAPMALGGGVGGGILGLGFGQEYPEETLATLGGGAALAAFLASRGKFKAGAATNAAASTADDVAKTAANNKSGWSFPWGKQQTTTPAVEIASNVKLTEFGSVGAAQAARRAAMEKAAQQQASSLSKVQTVVGEALAKIPSLGSAAGTAIAKNSGKIFGALGIAMTLPGIYEDIENGDYAAAAITATGLVGALATTGLTGGLGLGAGIGIGVGSSLLADQFRTSGKPPAADSRTTPTNRPAGSDSMRKDAIAEIEKARRGKNTSTSQQDMMDIIEKEFKEFGYSDIQIKAAQIAAAAESGLDPYAAGDNGASIGLFQLNRVAGEGKGFTVEQLSDPKNNARIAASRMAGKMGEAFRSATTLDAALEAWVRDFERPSFVRGGAIVDMAAYQNYVNRGAKIAANPQDVITGAVSTAISTGGTSDMSGAPSINVQALRAMGIKEDQIKALTNSQQYLGEMSDIMTLMPLLMGMGIDGKGAGGGGQQQRSIMHGSGPGHKVTPPPGGDPGSPEKVAMGVSLYGQLGSGTYGIQIPQ